MLGLRPSLARSEGPDRGRQAAQQEDPLLRHRRAPRRRDADLRGERPGRAARGGGAWIGGLRLLSRPHPAGPELGLAELVAARKRCRAFPRPVEELNAVAVVDLLAEALADPVLLRLQLQ